MRTIPYLPALIPVLFLALAAISAAPALANTVIQHLTGDSTNPVVNC